MNSFSFQRPRRWLRMCAATLLLAAPGAALFSFSVSSKLADDIWQQLGISREQGTEKIRNSFLNNYFDYYGIRNLKNLASGNRAGIAADLLDFAKKYLGSTAFQNEYNKLREQAKPVMPAAVPRTKEQVRKEKIDETQASIRDMEESMKAMDADMKKIMQPGLDMLKGNLKDYQDPNSQLIELFYQSELSQVQQNIDRYHEAMETWTVNFPPDPRELIKTRLKKYLDMASTVDFEASLTEKNGKKYFVNPAYERKNADWKMIYRAGKDVYHVTRTFAENWLKELP